MAAVGARGRQFAARKASTARERCIAFTLRHVQRNNWQWFLQCLTSAPSGRRRRRALEPASRPSRRVRSLQANTLPSALALRITYRCSRRPPASAELDR
jgi:hypothetical protein